MDAAGLCGERGKGRPAFQRGDAEQVVEGYRVIAERVGVDGEVADVGIVVAALVDADGEFGGSRHP